VLEVLIGSAFTVGVEEKISGRKMPPKKSSTSTGKKNDTSMVKMLS
jgi:hypothetical protein